MYSIGLNGIDMVGIVPIRSMDKCAYNLPAIPYTPDLLWLDFTDKSTITDIGGNISVIADKSVSGNDASQADPTKRPTISGVFDGIDDFLEFVQISTIRTAYLVVKHATGTDVNNTPLLGDPVLFNFSSFTGTAVLHSTNTPAGMAYASIGGARNARVTYSSYTRKPVSVATVSIASSTNLTAQYVTNDRNAAGRFWNGRYYEIMLFSSEHTKAQQREMEDWFHIKHSTWYDPTWKIIFDGDSLTAGQGASDAAHRYPNVTIATLGGTYDWTNYAVGAQTVVQMLSDVATQIDPHPTNTRGKNILFFWGGVNDLKGGAAAATVYNNIVSYCSGRQTAGYQVLVLTITPSTGLTAPQEANRVTVNTNIVNNWSLFADALVDVASDPDLDDPTDLVFYTDGTHMTDAGYAIVADLAYQQVILI